MAVNFRGGQFQNPGEGLLQGINQGLDIVGSVERIQTQRLARDLARLEKGLDLAKDTKLPKETRQKWFSGAIGAANNIFKLDMDPNTPLLEDSNALKGLHAIITNPKMNIKERMQAFGSEILRLGRDLSKEDLNIITTSKPFLEAGMGLTGTGAGGKTTMSDLKVKIFRKKFQHEQDPTSNPAPSAVEEQLIASDLADPVVGQAIRGFYSDPTNILKGIPQAREELQQIMQTISGLGGSRIPNPADPGAGAPGSNAGGGGILNVRPKPQNP